MPLSNFAGPSLSSVEEGPAEFVGQSIRPSIAALRQLVHQLNVQSQLGRGRPSQQRLINAFNAKAAYVVVLFLAATGARPTDGVFPTSPLIDLPTESAILSEKDSLLYRSTRVAQLDKRLISALQELATLGQSIALSTDIHMNRRREVFLLDKDGSAIPPTIPNMKKLLPEFREGWPWPNDALRHHFRSRLWELGCPSDCIAQLMGHVGKSHTADNILATTRIGEVNRKAAPYITRLIDELGFES